VSRSNCGVVFQVVGVREAGVRALDLGLANLMPSLVEQLVFVCVAIQIGRAGAGKSLDGLRQ